MLKVTTVLFTPYYEIYNWLHTVVKILEKLFFNLYYRRKIRKVLLLSLYGNGVRKVQRENARTLIPRVFGVSTEFFTVSPFLKLESNINLLFKKSLRVNTDRQVSYKSWKNLHSRFLPLRPHIHYGGHSDVLCTKQRS